MPLTAYHPLSTVYDFHQEAEMWIVRRYAQAIEVDDHGEPRPVSYVEAPVKIFRDPRQQQAKPDETGQVGAERCVVYTRANLRTLDSSTPDAPRFTDVLFDVLGVTGEPGSAWVVQEIRGWRDALGREAVLVRQGQRGHPPWV